MTRYIKVSTTGVARKVKPPASAAGASALPAHTDHSYLKATGLTGATAASRYVGATASGAPASGTFAVGDFVIDQTGLIYVCTSAGSPGTWASVAGSGALPTGTTAGDLAVYNGTAWVRVGAGADDTVLTADSGETEGVKWAAGGSGLWTLIDSVDVASATDPVTFSSIPGTFEHLLLTYSGRTVNSGNDQDGVFVTFNNDSGTNYGYTRAEVRTNTSDVESNQNNADFSGGTILFMSLVPGDGSAAGPAGHGRLWIPNYARTDFHKTCDLDAFYRSDSFMAVFRSSGVWASTAAITRIDLTVTPADWEAGSIFHLYGVG